MLRLNDGVSHKIQADIRHLPFPDSFFQNAVSAFVMRYLNLEEQIEAIIEVSRVVQNSAVIADFGHIGYHIEVSAFEPANLKRIIERLKLDRKNKMKLEIQKLKLYRRNGPGSPSDIWALVITKI